MNYKFTNAKLLMYDGEKFYIDEKDLFIKDKYIEKIGEENTNENYEEINMQGKLIMPGLINMHSHIYMSLFKNYADDIPFDEWLFKKIMPVEDVIEREDAYEMNLSGIHEMLSTGTTCFVDMHMFEGMSPKAARDAKIRAYVARSVVGTDINDDGKSRFEASVRERKEYESDLVNFMVMPHAIYTASPNLISQLGDYAKENNLLKQIHLSETNVEVNDCKEKYEGKTPVELLDSINFLDEKTTLAHCVKLEENDYKILRDKKVSVVTNVSSNAKLGNGIAPVEKMMEEGINVCIGTDGVSSNNSLNMFREMGILSLMHKASKENTLTLGANKVLKMATINAAKALQMEDKLGIIKEGALADLIFLDLSSPSLFPNNNIVSSLVYSANGSEVESVMINGEFVMRDRKILTFDSNAVQKKVIEYTKKYLNK